MKFINDFFIRSGCERAYIEIFQAELLESVVQSGFNNIGVELAISVVSVMAAVVMPREILNGPVPQFGGLPIDQHG